MARSRSSSKPPPATRRRVDAPPAPSNPRGPWLVGLTGLALVVAVVGAYWGVTGIGFVQVDDQTYVVENPVVQRGITLAGLRWAFFEFNASANWHPLTWISHMLDCLLFGRGAAGPHAVNLILHVSNTLVLFGLLWRWTGSLGRSALVAALFGLHPMHVESVAWIAERKDVLSTFFGLLALGAYARGAAEPGQPWARRHGWALGFFALSLMAKPMLVTLPFALLLLDYWPLGRWGWAPARGAGGRGSVRAGEGATIAPKELGSCEANGSPGDSPSTFASILRLLAEKVPYLVLTVGSCVVTFFAQRHGGAMEGLAEVGLAIRVQNAVVAYARYLGKLLWPSDLLVFYPYPTGWPAATVAACGLLLVLVTAAAIVLGRRYRFFPVGWFWFLGTLVPVIGVVQVGVQAMADRYSYVPSIGFFVVLVWGGYALAQSRRWAIATLRVAAGAGLVFCALASRTLVGYWGDDVELWHRAVTLAPEHFFSQYNYGVALATRRRMPEAIDAYRRAVALRPGRCEFHNNLGTALRATGHTEEALEEFLRAGRLDPRAIPPYDNAAATLLHLRRHAEAIGQCEAGLRIDPHRTSLRFSLACALGALNRRDEATAQFQAILRLEPDHVGAHCGLAAALEDAGRPAEAVVQWETVTRIQPGNAIAHSSLGILLVDNGQVGPGIEHLQEAVRLQPGNAEIRRNLELARQRIGR